MYRILNDYLSWSFERWFYTFGSVEIRLKIVPYNDSKKIPKKSPIACFSMATRLLASGLDPRPSILLYVIESYGVVTVRNDIMAPRRLATLSVGSMRKTPRLLENTSHRLVGAYSRPMRASPPLKDARPSRKGSKLDFRSTSMNRILILTIFTILDSLS